MTDAASDPPAPGAREAAPPAGPAAATIAPAPALSASSDARLELAGSSQWRDVWRQFRTHRGALLGLFFLLFVTLFCIFGPWLWQVAPNALDVRNKDLRPVYSWLWNGDARASWSHPLGTDQLGRDLLAQLIAGGRVSLAVGWTAMLLAMLIGTLVGVLAGYFRRLDGLLMRFTDLVLALPILPLLLVVMLLFRDPLRAAFGPQTGIFILIVSVIGVTSWMQTARIVRGDVMALKEREFVLAARSIGTPARRMIPRHILPNVLSPIMVSATLGLASAIITESALSFLGLGFPSDFPTWGKLLFDATDRMADFPERVLWPGLAISLTVLSVNYIGDGLRDALDPRIRGR
ncbi:ABC transporter permease [Rubellimicrobium sp. CFH 75288]|uniref:ABC transporter permease n=1 Tax=Rubellimicrobium sp. CFH 75288 TaxID=2697034 RepID=UPI0014127A24|nr:ABC transporter permease [Rubellimicrobium sp. CFH 75288]NAZ35354.1 ABC transporter permease subunit [Rubellimicrobium sp. CFH 75288]